LELDPRVGELDRKLAPLPAGSNPLVTVACDEAAVDLYWLPLGAGGYSVRPSGRAFETLTARLNGRPASALYHSALIVRLARGASFVIEQAPVPDSHGATRGVVGGGAVGAHWAGRARIFRYEIRRWQNGVISDVAEAVESPRRLTNAPRVARLLWRLVPEVPTPVWGRDQFGAGEMWNSNSVTSWLLARSGLDAESIRPPAGGRAPGWDGGVVIARRADERTVAGHSAPEGVPGHVVANVSGTLR
jgi:hypothetical protein